MKELLEQGIGIGIIGSMAVVGLISRILLFFYYGTLSRACKTFDTSDHKTIVYIREDLKQRERKKQEIKSTMIYTECRLAECKVLGIRSGVLESVARQSMLLVIISGVLVALAEVLHNSSMEVALKMLLVCGTVAGVFVVIDMFAGLQEKYKRIRMCIRDYIENARTSEEGNKQAEVACEPEESKKKKHRKEIKEEKKAEKRANREAKRERRENKKIRRTDKPLKNCKKKHGKAQEEKRRLTEELLRERRQLEARSLAEYRRKEREEEGTVQQAQAEAAVTECVEAAVTEGTEAAETVMTGCTEAESRGTSYETLLSEVLAEYLA